MPKINTEKEKFFNDQRNKFNLYADKLVENLPVLHINNVSIKIIAIMRDLDYTRTLPVHEHPDFELCINDAGKYISYAEDTHSTFSPAEKKVLLVPPGVLHYRKYCAALTVNTTFRFRIESPDYNAIKIHQFYNQYLLENNYQLAISDKMHKLYKLTLGPDAELKKENLQSDCHIVSALLCSLLQPLTAIDIPAPTENESAKNSHDLLVNQIKLLVAKYNNSPFFSNNFLWHKFNFSSNYLNRIFRQQTGMSIRHYWEIQRLKYIQNIIEDKDISFSNIAQMLKFSSASQFSKYVKLHFKMTPSEMREHKK